MATTAIFTQNGTGNTFNLSDGINTFMAKLSGVENSPQLIINSMPVARGVGKKVISTQRDSRSIEAQGKLVGSSTSDLRTRIDTMKQYMDSFGTLDVTFDGWASARRYFVYIPNVIITNAPYQLLWVPFSVQFEASDSPYGEDLTSTSLYSNAALTTNLSRADTMGGTISPNGNIRITAIPAGPGMLEIRNDSTNTAIIITRTWQTYEVLNVVAGTNQVVVNGLPVDYTGNNLTWKVGTNNWVVNFFPTTAVQLQSTAYNYDRVVTSSILRLARLNTVGTKTIHRIDLLLWKMGSPADLTFKLYKDWGVVGQTTLINQTLPAASVGNDPSWVPSLFAAQSISDADTPYAIELSTTQVADSDNAIYWKGNSTSSVAFADTLDDTGGLDTTKELTFKVWNTTALGSLSANVQLNYKRRWL